MYRYSVDNAVTYTSEDFVLFREAPFACWMERLSLENPDHGIPPDVGSHPPENTMERQDDIAETLRAEGKAVSLIDWDDDEPRRRAATLDAMRKGSDFIVNGQLALGPLSGSANLLMRTSGYSELGDYLYIPCDTQAKTSLHSTFRLCFLADLLHSLQGQLPPQLLVIRSGDDLVPLQTEDHIYHYRAVKQRFMAAMSSFRKHRMPDPAESSHFGRWSDCAHEVLKQRILREEQQELEQPQGGQESHEAAVDAVIEETRMPLRQAVGSSLQSAASPYDLDDINRRPEHVRVQASTAPAAGQTRVEHRAFNRPYTGAAPAGPTLAEQAEMLTPNSYKAGPGTSRFRPVARRASGSDVASADLAKPDLARPDLARPDLARPDLARPDLARPDLARPGQDRRVPDRQAEAGVNEAIPSQSGPEHNRRASDEALQNLEFIGSSRKPPVIGASAAPETGFSHTTSEHTAPPPSLRDPRARLSSYPEAALAAAPDPVLDKFDEFAGSVNDVAAETSLVAGPQSAGGGGNEPGSRSTVDRDSDHQVWREPVLRDSNLPNSVWSDPLLQDPVSRDPVLRDQDSPPPILATADSIFQLDSDTADSPGQSHSRENFYPGERPAAAFDPDNATAGMPVFKERAAEEDRERKSPGIFSDSLITSDSYDV
jgi:hypothetical protein